MEKDYLCKPVGYFGMGRSDISPYLPPQLKRTLDIGCGEGNFSKFIKTSLNAETWGIELHNPAGEIATAKLDRVLIGPVENKLAEIPDNYFDCVFMNDVIEHLVDPWIVLKSVKGKLVSGGVVIASIPNILNTRGIKKFFWEKDWQYEESGLFDRTHLRFFTRKSIVRLFNECGYVIDVMRGNAIDNYKSFIITFLSFGYLYDCRYVQYIVKAKKIS
jgi:SAM-dependent methyltransferase